ncbi:histidinol-phosphate transaminase [Thermosynechococcaceae cyanobacterium BACA0444]|uniref:Histidinol-phosphate aminotransferase n=1 Tax=Pseudocalidococcus azoricus BACA0444 TaxID=2918990 RepID=A0AAE4FUI1_9CYAN|nr:histidinol-phosphate transaminase [Pseudocalidococcus azoricus]MDS3862505.1 histidinol-phosphate transaminase [Pseudocalidococcus azoricus BACA0444]
MPFSFLRPELDQLQAYTTHADSDHLPSEPLDILDTNEFPADLPPDLKQKFVDHLWNFIPANRYPDGSHVRLKTAITHYVNSQITTPGQPITPDQVSLGCGSDELIRSILLATCGPGQGKILVAEPTFSMYGILARGLGIEVISIGRNPDHFDMDLAAADQALDNQAIQVIFVVHPNSPTGNALTGAEQAWLRTIPNSVLVVIDEAYFEFSGLTLAGELADHPNWLILRTFSKAWRLAAFRVGYGLGHPEVILALEKLRLPYNLTAPSLAAAQLVLSEQESLLGAVPGLLAQRDQMFQALQAIPQLRVCPSDGNFIYFQAQEQRTTQQLAQTLRQAGSLVRFTCDGIRLTIGTAAENERVLRRIQAWAKTR